MKKSVTIAAVLALALNAFAFDEIVGNRQDRILDESKAALNELRTNAALQTASAAGLTAGSLTVQTNASVGGNLLVTGAQTNTGALRLNGGLSINAAGGAVTIPSNMNWAATGGPVTIPTNVVVAPGSLTGDIAGGRITNALADTTIGPINPGTNVFVAAGRISSGDIAQARVLKAMTNEPTTGPVYLSTNVLLGSSAFSQATAGATTNVMTDGSSWTATVVRVGNIILTWTQGGP